MKTLRNCVIILVVLLIFVFFFAGKGVFDHILPLSEVKGAICLAVGSQDLVELADGYMTRGGEEQLLADHLEGLGYTVAGGEQSLTAEKAGQTLRLEKEGFLGCSLFRDASALE
ncbi:MAG: hypothetical protein IJP03_03865 [Christensenellaceae bacterium]|nr:hypothetical protein [Christensenellaceae bacterium]